MSRARWIGLSLLGFSSLGLSASLAAQGNRTVREIAIHSRWGGLGTAQDITVRIQATSDAEAPPIARPDPANLGITQNWLQSQLASIEDRMPASTGGATARQKELFESTFTDREKVNGILPRLFTYSSFDDYPSADISIEFSDGSQLKLTSHSYYEFMLPWTLNRPDGKETYNADISRAISALLPPKSTNRERLAGPEFASHLADAVARSIEEQWKLIGAEDRAGDSLAKLRSRYKISASDINPYHDAEFGVSWRAKGPHETNLHVTLHRSEFPPNLAVEGGRTYPLRHAQPELANSRRGGCVVPQVRVAKATERMDAALWLAEFL